MKKLHAPGPVIVAILAALLVVLAACSEEQGREQCVTVGLITNNSNGLRNIDGFKEGLRRRGYYEGQNITYLFSGAPTHKKQLDAALQTMVESGVNLIFTAGTPTGVAAHRVTAKSGTPVVFGVIADPVAAGVLKDPQRPGGNMTGVMLSKNQARRLEYFLEIAPHVRRLFIPYNPTDSASTTAVQQIASLAATLGIELVEGTATSGSEAEELIRTIPRDIDAVFMVPGTTVNKRFPDLLAVSLDRKLPLSAPSTIQVEQGALMTYGFVHKKAGIQAARIADQILRGDHPGNLPVETADYYLAINMKTAGLLGLEVPYDILQQAEILIYEQVTQSD